MCSARGQGRCSEGLGKLLDQQTDIGATHGIAEAGGAPDVWPTGHRWVMVAGRQAAQDLTRAVERVSKGLRRVNADHALVVGNSLNAYRKGLLPLSETATRKTAVQIGC